MRQMFMGAIMAAVVIGGWDAISEYCSGPEGVAEMVAIRADGRSFELRSWLSDQPEADILDEAQGIADRTDEAVAVVQGGRLVALINPAR